MQTNQQFSQLASADQLEISKKALQANGMKTVIVETAQEAKDLVLSLIPAKAQVFTMTSETLLETGITKEIDESGNFDSLRNRFKSMDSQSQKREMVSLGSSPEFAIGSVHAVTQDGKVLIASNTGSQLPAYVYGAQHVIWVVGTQKIVKDFDQAIKRIDEYVLPLESQRANQAYNITTGSNVSKLLVVNKEITPDRITIVFVKQNLGF